MMLQRALLERLRLASLAILLGIGLAGVMLLNSCAPTQLPASLEPALPPTPTATPAPVYYIVQPGDTLSAIALKKGISAEVLARVNELQNPDLLQIGQRLLISDQVTISGERLPTPTPTPLPCLEGCLRPPPGCQVKGIIARLDGARMYMLPDDELYLRFEAATWFCREEDAVRTGWARWTVHGPIQP